MARYFFSIRSGDRLIPDQEGIDLPASADLDACAVYLARKLRQDLGLPESDLGNLTVEVTDTGGELVTRVAVTG
ncbi:DUF6894 family protein [Enterovirga rhinocerotis]|uniref:DUF6894 domain-containing protein n=1 Tax=Enterovirga rhinocerotis TaxID=1339210 RepID=A0A4V3DXK1_9HYPH|nr:hypothetical protein [Enterovirga rhinocerotis]TDR89129.1 hypothetical protein EV668_3617 [Enterovirga rhinocerotis]